MTNVKSLLEMYVKMGGSLTDTYSDIAGGVPVGQYSTISDAILACSKKYSAGGGGGAEKFVVTLTKENDTWTADKTIAEIVAADEANQVVVAKYPRDGINIDIPLNMAMEYQGMYGAIFAGIVTSENNNKVVAVQCMDEGSGAAITIVEQPIPTSTNAPLIVTMTKSEQTPGTYVGDKTYGEVLSATLLGKNVTLAIGSVAAFNVLSVQAESSAYYIFVSIGGDSVAVHGSEEDYVTLSID